MPTTKKQPAQAHRATQPITPVMQELVKYIEAQTGYKADPMSVQLSGLLRGEFQKSPGNQARLAAQTERVAAEKAARAERASKIAKPQPATAPVKAPVRRRPLKGASAE
jgi:hypothetical protein